MLWHWLWSGLDQGKDLTIGCKGNLFPETGLCRAVVATVGVYSSSTFAGAQISDGGCSTPAYPPIQVHMGHTSPGEWFHKRTGVEELGTMISCASFLKALIIKMVTELGAGPYLTRWASEAASASGKTGEWSAPRVGG